LFPNAKKLIKIFLQPFNGENERDLIQIFKQHLSDEQKIITHAQDIDNEVKPQNKSY
jgi:hypothetical protein